MSEEANATNPKNPSLPGLEWSPPLTRDEVVSLSRSAEQWTSAPIPSAEELDAWLATLKSGHGTPEMLPRFVEGYKRLLKVAEAAERALTYSSTAELRNAPDALKVPVPETR